MPRIAMARARELHGAVAAHFLPLFTENAGRCATTWTGHTKAGSVADCIRQLSGEEE